MDWRRFLKNDLKTLITMPRVVLNIDDPGIYKIFTERHRFKVIRKKSCGVALLFLPDSFEQYMDGPEKKTLRRKYKKAEKSGITFKIINNPTDYFDDIMAIHNSSPERQGRPMDSEYLDANTVSKFLEISKTLHCAVDAEGKIRAYIHLIVTGDMAITSGILGHADFLEDGIMYFLFANIVREAIALHNSTGSPKSVMYDTYFGATEGLRYFKDRVGLAPYWARYKYVPGKGT